MIIGYGRVSTREQNLDRQRDALTDAGCEKVFLDVISTRKDFQARPQWGRMWEQLRAGDALVVVSLDRMGRDLRDLLGIIADLDERGVELRLLGGMFAGTVTGAATPEQLLNRQVLLAVAGAFAQYEREVNRTRTLDGLAAARKRGVKGGRKDRFTPLEGQLIAKLYADPSVQVRQICQQFKCSPDTVRRYARLYGEAGQDMKGGKA